MGKWQSLFEWRFSQEAALFLRLDLWFSSSPIHHISAAANRSISSRVVLNSSSLSGWISLQQHQWLTMSLLRTYSTPSTYDSSSSSCCCLLHLT